MKEVEGGEVFIEEGEDRGVAAEGEEEGDEEDEEEKEDKGRKTEDGGRRTKKWQMTAARDE